MNNEKYTIIYPQSTNKYIYKSSLYIYIHLSYFAMTKNTLNIFTFFFKLKVITFFIYFL